METPCVKVSFGLNEEPAQLMLISLWGYFTFNSNMLILILISFLKNGFTPLHIVCKGVTWF